MNLIKNRTALSLPLWTSLLVAIVLLAPTFLTNTQTALADPSEIENVTQTLWSPVSLPSDTCPAGDQNCHFGSPLLADINGNGNLEIIAVTNKGFVVAINANGGKMWEKDIAPHFGMSAGTHEIHARPAAADLDGDGTVEIVIGAGAIKPTVCTQGGVIVLNGNGQVRAGWPFLSADEGVPPAGCRDTIFSSPALGDLNNDGNLEIVVAGFDKRIYTLRHDGTLMPNYPANSALSVRFPTWPSLQGKLADNTWASPALADIDGDGYLDIIISTGEGNFDDRYGGDSGGWNCPYELPPGWADGYCGGSLYVLDRFGKPLPGFPRYVLEAINSSPAVADVTGDGNPEIFVGTGDFYYNRSPDHPTYGFRLFAFNSEGNDLPGWQGGKQVGGTVSVSPSIGDITGDDTPEIVVIASDRKVYAWQPDGSAVSGFPMVPRDLWNSNSGNYNTPMGIVLADYDGDGKMEIIFSQAGVVTVVDGNGQQITATTYEGNTKPLYYTEGQLLNTPAVGDLDGDGKLELVATNSHAFAWALPDSGNRADWPMFKRDAEGASSVPIPPRLATSQTLTLMHDPDMPGAAQATLTLQNDGGGSIEWQADAANRISLSPSSGSFSKQQTIQVSIDVSGLDLGSHNVGSITVNASSDGASIDGSPVSIPVTVLIAEMEQAYLPIITR